jgi:hypothetical protein
MCLCLTKDSARLRKNYRRRKRPIIVYKCIFNFGNGNIYSEYNDYKWSKGLNVSDRKTTGTNSTERKTAQVNKGFHFFLDRKEAEEYCRYRCRCQCPYPCRYQCPYRCQEDCPYFKVIELQVEPEDIVTVGKFSNKDCLVATKATLKE